MSKFVIFTYGFEPPTDEIMKAWGKWFQSIGDNMVDMGGPFGAGKEISHSGTKDLPMGLDSLTGYCVVNADSFADGKRLRRHAR